MQHELVSPHISLALRKRSRDDALPVATDQDRRDARAGANTMIPHQMNNSRCAATFPERYRAWATTPTTT